MKSFNQVRWIEVSWKKYFHSQQEILKIFSLAISSSLSLLKQCISNNKNLCRSSYFHIWISTSNTLHIQNTFHGEPDCTLRNVTLRHFLSSVTYWQPDSLSPCLSSHLVDKEILSLPTGWLPKLVCIFTFRVFFAEWGKKLSF